MEERLGEMRKGRRERNEKGSHCFFKSSGYDKLELKHQNFVLFKEVFSHPYISFFHLLVNGFSVTCFRTFFS